MRQILYGEQWIHPEEPQEIQEIFFKYGQKRKLNKGQELLHGGPTGEITLLLKGLCLYRFWDWEDKEHILYSSLIFGSFSQRFRQKIPALGSIRSQLKSQHFDTLSQESTGWAVNESIYVLIFPVWHPKSAQIPNFRQIHPNSRQFFSKNRHCVPNFRHSVP